MTMPPWVTAVVVVAGFAVSAMSFVSWIDRIKAREDEERRQDMARMTDEQRGWVKDCVLHGTWLHVCIASSKPLFQPRTSND